MKYFDYAATCPLDSDAASAYVKAATEYYGNTQSLHDIGSQASALLENCRKQIALFLGVESEGVYFTSGGSESNFLAIHSLLSNKEKKGIHIITSIAEHSSIHSALKKLDGFEITQLPLNEKGIIDMNQLREAIREDTVLVCIQHVNPEIGTIQPIVEIGGICKGKGILLHCDCVQSFSKLDMKEITRSLDSLSISGHKFYGPKGIGAMYISPHIHFQPYYPNASHERGMRPGTVNVPAIVSMTTAAAKQVRTLSSYNERMNALRLLFVQSLEEVKDKLVIYSSDAQAQLPAIVGMRIKGLEGQWVMLEANRKGFAISTGSACQVGLSSPSKTMRALNVEGKEAKEFIRISFGINTTVADIHELANLLIAIIQDAYRK